MLVRVLTFQRKGVLLLDPFNPFTALIPFWIPWTLKMTSAQVVEMSVTNNSSFQNYSHPDDHTIQTKDKLC